MKILGRASAAVVIALAMLVPSPSSAADHAVVVETDRLAPPVLTIDRAGRVVFENRAGSAIHVEFAGHWGHRVSAARERTAVIFERPGPHPYVVHVGGSRPLRGVVAVEGAALGAAGIAECPSSSTGKEMCLER